MKTTKSREMSPEVLGQPFNFGYFRAQGDLLLYGLVGASVALEADLGIMLTGDKQGVKGTPKGQKGAKAKAGAKGGIELFAGIKEGVQLSGAVQWLNPEGVLGTGKPKKLKANQAIAEFADIAKVSLGGEAIEGLAAKLGFECAFRNGSFRIAADANLCLGLGGGKVAADVGAATIGDFCMCVCHMLKQADYHKMVDVMEEDTFKTFNKILFLVDAGGGRVCSRLRRRQLMTWKMNMCVLPLLPNAKAVSFCNNSNNACAPTGAGLPICRLRDEGR